MRLTTYEITLRRDVQQVTSVRVQANSRQAAITIAESAIDPDAWNVECVIGTHSPQVNRIATAQRKPK